MHIPGFTAEATLYRANRNYHAAAAAPTDLGSGALTLARRKTPELGYIDCKDYPYSVSCRECGATGPDSAICCPNDYCIINNPPDARGTNLGFHANLGTGTFARI